MRRPPRARQEHLSLCAAQEASSVFLSHDVDQMLVVDLGSNSLDFLVLMCLPLTSQSLM